MSWISKALETYEQNRQLAGVVLDGKTPLLPVAHMMFKAQLELTIDQDGSFVGASALPDNPETIIPVTEASGGRSSGAAAHALNDTLAYVAGDFKQFTGIDNGEKYKKYLNGLENWVNSAFSTRKVRAVWEYVKRGRIMEDLVRCRLLYTDESGRLVKGKIAGADYEKVLVRFRVYDAENPMETSATWEDTGLMQAYTDYYHSVQSGKTDICYLTGERSVVTSNHPKGTVAASYGAKLISANDNANFTFRGRFEEASEASCVSYDASQKAHAALAWLSREQGICIGGRTYICWTPTGKRVDTFRNNLNFGSRDEEEEPVYTAAEYGKRLNKAFWGYKVDLQTDDRGIVIIGLDAATTGRLSVTYYSELDTGTFLESMYAWEKSCRWYFREKGSGSVIRAVSARQIVECAFGSEQGSGLGLDDRILKQQIERLIPCLTEKSPIPYDFVHALFCKASAPQAYGNWWNRERVLSTACAVINKYYSEKDGVEGDREMVLDSELNLDSKYMDRSYWFGCMLAVIDWAESSILYRKKNKDDKEDRRTTNAIKYWSAYVNHPMTTWKTLQGLLVPYYDQMDDKGNYCQKLLGELLIKLLQNTDENQDSELNKSLSETFLLGYFLQREKLWRGKKDKSEKTSDENNDNE